MSSTVHVVQCMKQGGIETLVLDLALADPEIHIISLEGQTEALCKNWPALKALGDRFLAFNKPNHLDIFLIKALAGCLKRLKTRAVVTHHIGPLLYAGPAARLAFIKTRIHVEHDAWHYQNARRRHIARLLYYWINPRCVAVSKKTAEAISAALNLDYFEIIANGVDMDRFRPSSKIVAREAFNLPQDKLIVGSVGRLVHVKGQDVLIEALLDLEPNIHLALVGDGKERAALEALSKRLNVQDRVHFLGTVNRPEVIYPAFDLFCLPSRGEGFPRSLIEAQACDVRVLATDVGGCKEAVCPLTGVMAKPGNAKDLADQIIFMINNPVSTSPRHFVNPKFSFKRTIEAYRQVCT